MLEHYVERSSCYFKEIKSLPVSMEEAPKAHSCLHEHPSQADMEDTERELYKLSTEIEHVFTAFHIKCKVLLQNVFQQRSSRNQFHIDALVSVLCPPSGLKQRHP